MPIVLGKAHQGLQVSSDSHRVLPALQRLKHDLHHVMIFMPFANIFTKAMILK